MADVDNAKYVEYVDNIEKAVSSVSIIETVKVGGMSTTESCELTEYGSVDMLLDNRKKKAKKSKKQI